MITFFNTNLGDLLNYPFDSSKRIFIGYLIGAVVLALPVYFAATKADGIATRGIKGFTAFLLPKEVFLAASAKLDYQLFVLNKLIKAVLFAPLMLTMVPVALSVSSALESLFGGALMLDVAPWLVMSLFTILLFILDDFSRFLLHYLLHKVPWLWQFHKVHHSATVLTPFTIYRTHPVESYLYGCRMALSQGVVVGIGYAIFGPTLKMYDVLGANVFVFAFNVLGANLRHSHIWLSWGDKLENWFISPAQHQVHHSSAIEHRDTNLGSALAIWDRALGCLIKASSVSKLTLGVGKFNGHNSLWGIYSDPFKQIFSRCRQLICRIWQRVHTP
ncbi:sterol desaturase family protein [Shewanella pneumatophori]|uniref:Sterol desaturase family protein n=1 Tax=Shewanella pneumatophori TaxID=314092 RepID=A0A9X1ZEE3_9GAMM|nr:sterol desaturase family protein [Shewanella pneumatophori]